jgi:hypothetical protein
MKIESRIGKIQTGNERVYHHLADFSRLGEYVKDQKVSDFKSDTDSCSFKVDNMGYFGMRIIEREPYKLIKIVSDEQMPFGFTLWIQLKEVDALDIRVKVTLEAQLNQLMALMAKGPLTKFVESLVDKLETLK